GETMKMIGVFLICVSPILFYGADGQDLPTCSASWGSSCPAVTPLVSGLTCPNGFDRVEDYCFKVSDERVFWNESIPKCEELNAMLAEPKELLFNFTVFANYLLQHQMDDYYDYIEWKPNNFHLGGHYTNNSWEWLTGGNISNAIYGSECLAVNVWQNMFPEISSRQSENIGFHLWSVPCNSSAVVESIRDFVYGSYRYVCQAALENNSYNSCRKKGKEYSSGELVSRKRKRCKQNWCQDGNIQKYTCGNIKKGCCVYKGDLYGDGDIIGPEVPTEDCSGCHQRVCQAGDIQWQDCTNCSVKC
ncbi:unnamed protein product, partial [Meganyctiphanes norvegica]